jgi:hypothetical protein
MDGPCRANGKEEKCVQGFDRKAWSKETAWKTEKWMGGGSFREKWEGVDWGDVVQDTDKWLAVVSAVMKLQVV